MGFNKLWLKWSTLYKWRNWWKIWTRKQLFNARSFKKPVKKLKLASTTLPHLFQTNLLFTILLKINYKYDNRNVPRHTCPFIAINQNKWDEFKMTKHKAFVKKISKSGNSGHTYFQNILLRFFINFFGNVITLLFWICHSSILTKCTKFDPLT